MQTPDIEQVCSFTLRGVRFCSFIFYVFSDTVQKCLVSNALEGISTKVIMV
jgi:hypothetical protein